ncbi:uncharacterized protein LOC113851639 [Abrus precatorius]|uniref:Uncharacterized protein LOC113851639 n=1 Tax=Abrus precatorius TaxID=3816 RepID=A0A8B8K2U9_ABRPR|nr:uncharacterized protein LOC113851639 [Abrus precatorius]
MPEIRSTNLESLESTTSLGMSFPSPLNGVIIFVVTTLGGYLQIQYQTKKLSPFEEHYEIMWAVSVALSLYSAMLIAELKFHVHKYCFLSIIKRFTVLMGALVAVLLTIIILPLFGYFKLLLWIVCFAKATLVSREEICDWFRHGFCETIEMLCGYFGRENNSLPV